MSPLTGIPAKTRKTIYRAYTVVVMLVGATQAGYASLDAHQPKALTVALAVLAYVGAGLGLTAASNVSTGDEPPAEDPQAGEVTVWQALVAFVALLLFIVVFTRP